MWIEKVLLTNVGPFRGSREFTLQQGAVGIFGANGAGKSSLIDLMFAAITGDFGRFVGVRTDVINDQAPKEEPAGIRLWFHHAGASLVLNRQLRPVKYSLTIGEQKPITKADDGAEELRRLGIDKRVLEFCVFKRQPGCEKGAIDDFLRTTPAARAEAYMALCGTEHCELIHKTVDALYQREQAAAGVFVDDVDALAASVAAIETQQKELQAKKPAWKKKLMQPQHQERALEIVRKAEQLPELQRLLAKQEEHLELLARLQGARAVVAAETEQALQAAQQALTAGDCQRQADEARVALGLWQQAQRALARRDALTRESVALAIELQNAVVPPTPDLEQLTRLTQELEELKRQQAADRARLDVFDKTGRTACPTCGTAVAHLTETLEECRTRTAAFLPRHGELTSALAALARLKTDFDAYRTWKADHTRRLQENEQRLRELTEDAPPTLTESDCRERIARCEEANRRERTALAAHHQATCALTEARTQHEAASGRWNELANELAKAQHPEELVGKARQRLREHAEAAYALERLDGELAGLDKRQGEEQTRLDAARARRRRAARATRAAAILERVKRAFHKQALPQRVAEHNLAQMVDDINRGLDLLGSPFSVTAKDGLSFYVHKPGQPSHAAERLSGGWKMVLALAFWPAVSRLWRSELGLLVLDEPTANLDEDNVAALRDAIAGMTAEIRGQQQLLMITHADALRPYFDQVIDL